MTVPTTITVAPDRPASEVRREEALTAMLKVLDSLVPYPARALVFDAIMDYGAAVAADALDTMTRIALGKGAP